MKIKKINLTSMLMLVVISTHLTGCDAFLSDEEIAHRKALEVARLAKIEDVHTRKTFAYNKGNSGGGILTVDFGSRVFKVPSEYLRHASRDVLDFGIQFLWPSRCVIRANIKSICQKDGNQVNVSVLDGRDQKNLKKYSFQERKEILGMTGPFQASGLPPGLELYYDSSRGDEGDVTYLITDKDIKDHFGNKVSIGCFGVPTIDGVRTCRIRGYYDEDIKYLIQFTSNHLQDWKAIYTTVITLLDKFSGDKP